MIRSRLFWPSLFVAVAIIYCCTVVVYDTVSADALLYGLTGATMAHLFTVSLVVLTFLVTAVFFVFTFIISNKHRQITEELSEMRSKMFHTEMELREYVNSKLKTKKKP